MWNENVCRLCLSEKELCNVFDNGENQVDNLKRIVFITTGVEILENDVVSRKICVNCRKVTIKMSEFRERSIKTDTYLKEQYAEYAKKNIITKDVKDSQNPPKKSGLCKKNVNRTISNIFKSYPYIKLPTNVLSYDVDPSVWMELDAVENYYIHNKLNMNNAVQIALKRPRVKKRDTTNKNKIVNPINIKLSDDKVILKDAEEKSSQNRVKRRRLSSADFTSDSEPPPTLMDTLQLEAIEGNTVRCKFCTKAHENTCPIFTNKVIVQLVRIDSDKEAIKKYPVLDKTVKTSEIIELSDDEEENEKSSTETKIPDLPPKMTPLNTLQYFSTAIVRPDVKIKDNTVLNSIDTTMSDIEVLKHLIKTKIKISLNEQTQTELPVDDDISRAADGNNVAFKNLKSHLHNQKIPVIVKKGEFKVNYVIDKGETPKSNRMDLWSNMKPVRLITNKPIGTQFKDRLKSSFKPAQQIVLNQYIVPINSTNTNSTTHCSTNINQTKTHFPNTTTNVPPLVYTKRTEPVSTSAIVNQQQAYHLQTYNKHTDTVVSTSKQQTYGPSAVILNSAQTFNKRTETGNNQQQPYCLNASINSNNGTQTFNKRTETVVGSTIPKTSNQQQPYCLNASINSTNGTQMYNKRTETVVGSTIPKTSNNQQQPYCFNTTINSNNSTQTFNKRTETVVGTNVSCVSIPNSSSTSNTTNFSSSTVLLNSNNGTQMHNKRVETVVGTNVSCVSIPNTSSTSNAINFPSTTVLLNSNNGTQMYNKRAETVVGTNSVSCVSIPNLSGPTNFPNTVILNSTQTYNNRTEPVVGANNVPHDSMSNQTGNTSTAIMSPGQQQVLASSSMFVSTPSNQQQNFLPNDSNNVSLSYSAINNELPGLVVPNFNSLNVRPNSFLFVNESNNLSNVQRCLGGQNYVPSQNKVNANSDKTVNNRPMIRVKNICELK